MWLYFASSELWVAEEKTLLHSMAVNISINTISGLLISIHQ